MDKNKSPDNSARHFQTKWLNNSARQFQAKWLNDMNPTIEALIANPAHRHFKALSQVLRDDIMFLRDNLYSENQSAFNNVANHFQIVELQACVR